MTMRAQGSKNLAHQGTGRLGLLAPPINHPDITLHP